MSTNMQGLLTHPLQLCYGTAAATNIIIIWFGKHLFMDPLPNMFKIIIINKICEYEYFMCNVQERKEYCQYKHDFSTAHKILLLRICVLFSIKLTIKSCQIE